MKYIAIILNQTLRVRHMTDSNPRSYVHAEV